MIGVVQEKLRPAHPQRERYLQRGCIQMFHEQPGQMPRSYPETFGKLLEIFPVQSPRFDHFQCAFDSRPGALPGGAERRSLGTASKAGPEACLLRRRCAAMELDVARKRRSSTAHGAAINPRAFDRDEHDAVPCRVPAPEGLILFGEIQHGNDIAAMAWSRELGRDDRVRKRLRVAVTGGLVAGSVCPRSQRLSRAAPLSPAVDGLRNLFLQFL